MAITRYVWKLPKLDTQNRIYSDNNILLLISNVINCVF